MDKVPIGQKEFELMFSRSSIKEFVRHTCRLPGINICQN